MANYVIEGTVSELAKEKSKVAVKIVGSEGYAIKQGDKTYNVFCPKNMPEAGNCGKGYIIDSKIEFTGNKEFENILTQASMHGKKIRLTIELEDGKNLKDYIRSDDNNLSLPIKSVTLLQK